MSEQKRANLLLGSRGESFACRQIKRYGLQVLRRNFSMLGVGEIDIVARDGLTLCFVEVKTRQTSQYGSAREAVNWEKRTKIYNTALAYLSTLPNPKQNFRFDMVEVYARGKRIISHQYLWHIFTSDDIRKVF